MPTTPTPPMPRRLPHLALARTLLPRLASVCLTAVGLAAVAGFPAPVAAAEPPPVADLKPFPAPAAGERRWVVRLPMQPPTSADPALSDSPSDLRVQLIVGKEVMVDCNPHSFNGSIERETIKGWGYPLYRVTAVGPMASTRMACPPGRAPRRVFLPMGPKPFVVPYNAKLPVVLYAPADLELRWRLWRAEKTQLPANQE